MSKPLDWNKTLETMEGKRVASWTLRNGFTEGYPIRAVFEGDEGSGNYMTYTLEGHYWAGERQESPHDLRNVSEAQPKSVEQHPITGYRVLSAAEVERINNVKTLAAAVGDQIDRLELHEETDLEWTYDARKHLQHGFMALVRAIAQPEGF